MAIAATAAVTLGGIMKGLAIVFFPLLCVGALAVFLFALSQGAAPEVFSGGGGGSSRRTEGSHAVKYNIDASGLFKQVEKVHSAKAQQVAGIAGEPDNGGSSDFVTRFPGTGKTSLHTSAFETSKPDNSKPGSQITHEI